MKRFGPALALLVLGLGLTLPRLGTSGLWDPWEPRYSQTAREMVVKGDWIVPHYRGDVRLVKPPLSYWLIGMSHSMLGAGEAAARLPSALLAALCPAVLALAFAARGRWVEGWIAGAALLTSPQWILLGRFATPDIPLAASLALALAVVIALPAVARRGFARGLAALAVVLVGLATLTDWPRGLVLPACAVVGVAAVHRRWAWAAALAMVAVAYYVGQHQRNAPLVLAAFAVVGVAAFLALKIVAGLPGRRLLSGSLLLLLVVAPWFLLVFQREPAEAADHLLGYKYGLNLGEAPGGHTGVPWEVLRLVVLGALPWSAAAIAGLVRGVGRRRAPADDIAALLVGTLAGYLLFFGLAEAQMGHFYAVIQPPLAGLAGIGVASLLRERRWSAVLVGLGLGLLGWLVWNDPSAILETATVKSSLSGIHLVAPVAATLIAWGAILGVAIVTGRERWALGSAVPPLVLAAFLGMGVVPALADRKSLKSMWERYLELRGTGQPIGTFSETKDSILYYSGDQIVELEDARELREFLGGPGAKFLVVPSRAYRAFGLLGLPRGQWEELVRDHPTHRLVRFLPEDPRMD